MRILFIIAVYPPEGEPTAVMGAELAREWSRMGHSVYVICPLPNRPQGVLFAGFKRRPLSRFNSGAVRGVRVWTWLVGEERRPLNRVLENVTFGLMSSLVLLFSRKPDVVVAESWPIFAMIPVSLVCALRRIKLVNYIKDLYPEALIAARMLRSDSLGSLILTS